MEQLAEAGLKTGDSVLLHAHTGGRVLLSIKHPRYRGDPLDLSGYVPMDWYDVGVIVECYRGTNRQDWFRVLTPNGLAGWGYVESFVKAF